MSHRRCYKRFLEGSVGTAVAMLDALAADNMFSRIKLAPLPHREIPGAGRGKGLGMGTNGDDGLLSSCSER